VILQGTIINVVAVVAGSFIGRWAERYLSAQMRNTRMVGLGLAVLLIGLKLALQSQQVMIVIGRPILGGLLIVAIALDLMGIKRLPVGNLLPAVFVTIPLFWVFGLA